MVVSLKSRLESNNEERSNGGASISADRVQGVPHLPGDTTLCVKSLLSCYTGLYPQKEED